MAKKDSRFDYDNRPLSKDEILVPFPFDEDFAKENITNKDCIGALYKSGLSVKVMYQAVPASYEKDAKQLINLVQNEELGHYAIPNSISIEGHADDYEHELCTVPSVESVIIAAEEQEENAAQLRMRLTNIIFQAPKLGYAMLLIMDDPKLKGTAFEAKMHLGRDAAATVRKNALTCIRIVLKEKRAVTGIKMYRSKHDSDYREEAFNLLDRVVDSLYTV